MISIVLPHLSGTSSIPGFSNLGPYLLQDKNTTDISSHPRVLLLLPGDQSSAANETLKSLRSLRRNDSLHHPFDQVISTFFWRCLEVAVPFMGTIWLSFFSQFGSFRFCREELLSSCSGQDCGWLLDLTM